MLKKQMILNSWISVLFGVQSNYAWNGTKKDFCPSVNEREKSRRSWKTILAFRIDKVWKEKATAWTNVLEIN